MTVAPLQQEAVSQAISQVITDAQIQINLSGANVDLIVISSTFEGLSTLKRQQAVLQPLADYIQSGELHAVSMKTFTPEQWQTQQVFHSL